MDKSIVPVNQIATRSSTCYEFSNPNEAEVVEIEDDPVEVVEKQIEDLKLDQQFNEKHVPEIFQTFINSRISGLEKVYLKFEYLSCSLHFDDFNICFEKKADHWTVTYEQVNTTIETLDPEKSIIDHLWFVLKNPDLEFGELVFFSREDSDAEKNQILDSEKLATLLQSMIDSIDHQLHTTVLACIIFNEDQFLSILKHVKPGTLDKVCFFISWKNEGNYQKMKEIVETDQWKQASTIISTGVTPLEVDDLFQYERFCLQLDLITSEDVLRVLEHVFNSVGTEFCILYSQESNYDIDAIIDFLRSQNDGSATIKTLPIDPSYEFRYEIVTSAKRVSLFGTEDYISFEIAND